MILISILSTLAFILISVAYDGGILNAGRSIRNHASRFIFRCIFFSLFFFHSLEYVFASALLFTALFDQLLNFVRKLPFWYLGTVAKWDKFFNKKYFLTPKISWRGKIIKQKYISFNFKILYIILKALSLFGSIFLFLL
jgi:hypothetical protein